VGQAFPMAQALPIAQTTHTNVLACNTKEPKFIMPEKFDGTRSKFYVNLFLQLQPSRYPHDSTQVAIVDS
jgi:hypothetical protein